MRRPITLIQCRLDDESIGASLCPEQDDPRPEQDKHDRLHAFSCERCQSLVDHTLTMDGGEAVCDNCLGQCSACDGAGVVPNHLAQTWDPCPDCQESEGP